MIRCTLVLDSQRDCWTLLLFAQVADEQQGLALWSPHCPKHPIMFCCFILSNQIHRRTALHHKTIRGGGVQQEGTIRSSFLLQHRWVWICSYHLLMGFNYWDNSTNLRLKCNALKVKCALSLRDLKREQMLIMTIGWGEFELKNDMSSNWVAFAPEVFNVIRLYKVMAWSLSIYFFEFS